MAKEFLIGTLLVLFPLVTKTDVLTLPYYWDELGYVIPSAYEMYLNRFYPIASTVPYIGSVGHPPVFYEVLAVAWSVAGYSVVVTRVVVLLCAGLALYATYRLGAYLIHPWGGLAAALLLWASPLFFAQSGIAHLDVPLTTLSLFTVYCAVTDRRGWYLVVATLMVLTKTPGVVLIPAVLFYRYLTTRAAPTRDRIADLVVYTLPVIPAGLWFAFHYAMAGYIHVSMGMGDATFPHRFEALALAKRLAVRGIQLCAAQSRWVLSLVLLCALRPILGSNVRLFFMVAIGVSLGFYTIVSASLSRYFLPVLPLFIILSVDALFRLCRQRTLIAVPAAVFITVLFASGWHLPSDRFSAPEASLEYVDFVKAHAAAARVLEDQYPDATVMAGWPSVEELSRPFLGYVQTPLKVIDARLWIRQTPLPSITQPRPMLFYYSPRDQGAEEVWRLIRQTGGVRLHRFEVNGELVEIYQS